ncbi:MAG: polysaccharide export protein [Hyphomicrobiaceae bacterium]|nr:polysaccharide export protein [Hyphomicrobiaceae bacterium]
MSSRTVVLILAATLLLTGCKSSNRKLKPSRIAPSHQATQPASKYMAGDPRHAVDPSYDPFFDRSRHPVKAKQMRGFPHANTTVWTDRSRDHFSYADIYANTGLRYQLDTGDVVRIDVFEQSNLSRLYRVDGGGFVSMPLIGAVHARGMTTRTLEREVARKLRRSYIRDPKVTVEISTHRPFYILGEVRNSGKYPFVLGMTVEMAVAIAGGYAPRANQKKVMVIRRLGGKLVRTYVPNHYQIKPGDTLKIVERLF